METAPVASVTGPEAQVGQTVKVDGRWHTITGFPDDPIYQGLSVRYADATDVKGKPTFIVLDKDARYPLKSGDGQAAPVMITVRNWRGDGYMTVAVRYRKRESGGWSILRADNERRLGWICKGYREPDWSAYVDSEAFRGDGVNDTGHVLDDVPLYLFNGENTVLHRPVSEGCPKREDAVEAIILWLNKHGANALGYGSHYDVRRWADR
jgi:hypothetical protein